MGRGNALFDPQGLITQSILVQHVICLVEHENLDIRDIDNLHIG